MQFTLPRRYCTKSSHTHGEQTQTTAISHHGTRYVVFKIKSLSQSFKMPVCIHLNPISFS
uniref:Uncharacterized protein n=1 Tax=Anguilla anguilla TaxID=7936 RepID=A0A0E9XCX1_ANGAN